MSVQMANRPATENDGMWDVVEVCVPYRVFLTAQHYGGRALEKSSLQLREQ